MTWPRSRRPSPRRGGEQVVDRQELENVGSFAYFKDTEGNIFGAMQSAQ